MDLFVGGFVSCEVERGGHDRFHIGQRGKCFSRMSAFSMYSARRRKVVIGVRRSWERQRAS